MFTYEKIDLSKDGNHLEKFWDIWDWYFEKNTQMKEEHTLSSTG